MDAPPADAAFDVAFAALGRSSEGTIAARRVAPPSDERFEADSGDALRALEARRLIRKLDEGFRSASFSRLVHEGTDLAPLEAEGVDRDEVADRAGAERGASVGDALVGFPRGTRTGLVVHEALEHLVFDAPLAEQREMLEGCLMRHRFDPTTHLDALVATLEQTVATPLDPPGFTLSALSRTQRLDELEFLFPVARREGARLTSERLAKVLGAHGSPTIVAYAKRAARLGFRPLAGFLQGFVDLVAEHDGRFYVIDYKTNDLGGDLHDYAGGAIAKAMVEHDYVLQALLYSVAVHRYLGHRLRGYDYERCFGGIRYLFVRGMSPSHPAGTGIYAERPTAALVEALDELLRAPGGTE